MNKENERITYEEFMTMFKFAPRMAFTLYDKAEDEIEKITKEKNHYKHLYSEVKKQKDDVVEYIKHAQNYGTMAQVMPHLKPYVNGDDLLRMLGEIDVED